MIATRRFTRLVLLAALVLPMAAFAKRIPAPVIEPVVHEGVRYTVPNDRGTVGYVVAWDVATGKHLWKKTIFRKCICPFLEHDVQWVFIKQMRLDGERLIFVRERDKSYALCLKTRRVKNLKQQRRAKRGPNKIGRANRRPASPHDAGRQFESASCAPPSPSAAVAHLWRSHGRRCPVGWAAVETKQRPSGRRI
jgi:hypothetical protein